MRRAGLSLVLISGSALALPPNSPHREGANHRAGDDSWVVAHQRMPTSADPEKSRMKVHLQYIRGVLAAKPATEPTLERRRAELLGYLDDYIAAGITPKNWALPWRTPVFIDDRGAICAVGYLIERSVGRALPEQIAAKHRYDYLEDIAAAMPEVTAWVKASGFTLDELASIQPGYTEPDADTWQRWFVKEIPDGEYRSKLVRESASAGRFKNHKMQGKWETFAAPLEQGTDDREHDPDAAVIGRGTLRDGSGTWTSYYDDGKLLAKGPFANNDPHGTWRFYHPSGKLAAVGEFWRGTRAGRWEFFHDSNKRTPIATGRFNAGGHVAGRWKHFDARGELIATSHRETPAQWKMYPSGPNNSDGEVIAIVPGPDRVRHSISIGTIDGGQQRLDTYALGGERLYVYKWPYENDEFIFDAAGYRLTRDSDGAWSAADCKWSNKRKAIAATGDVARMHGLFYREHRQNYSYEDKEPNCGEAKAVTMSRAKRLDAVLATRDKIRSASPQFVRDMVLGDQERSDDEEPDLDAEDMTRLIAKHMSFYVQWPHIDGRFIQVFRTLPGHVQRYWWDEMMGQSDGS